MIIFEKYGYNGNYDTYGYNGNYDTIPPENRTSIVKLTGA